MSRLASQAVVLSIARIGNYALAFLSPLILVRLLPVEEFGRYREFLTYATVLVSFAGFSVTDSLLTFLPKYPQSTGAVVRHTVKMVLIMSSAIVGTAALLDVVSGGSLFAGFVWPLSLYILLFINVDFWEWYWLARGRPTALLVYSAGRLAARMIVVIVAAALTRDVNVIVWWLVALEAVRLTGALWFWAKIDRVREPALPAGFAREQWRFCLPWGLAIVVAIASRNLGNVAVVKMLGTAALAHYAIGLYGEPIISALRNSISSVLLPEMVRRESQDPEAALHLWRQAVVVTCLILVPIVVICLRYAEPLVVTAFGAAYAPAASVLQAYMIVVIRECFDLTLPFRARGHSRSFVHSGVVGLAVNSALAFVLISTIGIVGAVLALGTAMVCEALWLGWSLSRFLGIRPGGLLPWKHVAHVFLAGALALAVLWADEALHAASLLSAGVLIPLAMLMYVGVIAVGRLPEVQLLMQLGGRVLRRGH